MNKRSRSSTDAPTSLFRKVSISLCALAVPIGVAAEDHANKTRHEHYKLIDLGTLGGPAALKSVNAPGYQILTNAGEVAFQADTPTPDPNAPICFNSPDCFVAHAVHSRPCIVK